MSPTTVLFDPEIFVRQSFGGISRYFSEIITGLTINPSLHVLPMMGFSRSSNFHLRDALVNLDIHLSPLRPSLRGLNRLVNGPDRVKDGFLTYRAGRAPRQRADILHATYLRPRSSDRARSNFLVATIQDVIAEQMNLSKMHPARRGKSELITRADLVITTSHATASEIETRWPGRQIEVIPLAVDAHFFAENPNTTVTIPFPYFLYVGGRRGYKNFEVVPKAIANLRTRQDVGLVCVGPPLSSAELSKISELANACRFEHVQASDHQLVALYRGSLGLVYPSLMEGFGLPVLEAAAAGCPAILSDIAPFRELANGWAMFFEATSPEALSLTLESSLLSPTAGIAPSDVVSQLPTWAGVTRAHAAAYHALTA